MRSAATAGVQIDRCFVRLQEATGVVIPVLRETTLELIDTRLESHVHSLPLLEPRVVRVLDEDGQTRTKQADHDHHDRVGQLSNGRLVHGRRQRQPRLEATPQDDADRDISPEDLAIPRGAREDPIDGEAEEASRGYAEHRVEDGAGVAGERHHHPDDEREREQEQGLTQVVLEPLGNRTVKQCHQQEPPQCASCA